jgi:mono/diheme cytochrome c family protein
VELDDLRAFQLFTGRDEEVDLSALTFSDGFVETGKALFDEAPSVEGTRSCGGCHGNAGANNAAGDNRLFATGANKHPNAPACLPARRACQTMAASDLYPP